VSVKLNGMNTLHALNQFVVLAALPLLPGGCGVEKPKVEPVAEVKPQLEGVNNEELEFNGVDGIAYHKGSPYTGKTYSLHPNGKKKLEWNYKDGELDGLITRWRDNGQKKSEGNYKDGSEDGLRVSWYTNGQKMHEVSFKGGHLDGLEVWWDKNGQKKSELKYQKGKLVEGSEKYWNSEGEPVDLFGEALEE
jgi:antitoxin component YwqK of YwqJK toxin-antitoxin module